MYFSSNKMLTFIFLLLCSQVTIADEITEEGITDEEIEACVSKKFKESLVEVSYASIKQTCILELNHIEKPNNELPVFYQGLLEQKKLAFEASVITPHEVNYLLPIVYTNNFNYEPYEQAGMYNYASNLSEFEAKFQISFKLPLTQIGVFSDKDLIAFAFTLTSWWQVYNEDLSRPFRETNYRPEIFYGTPLNWEPFGGNTFFVFGFAHESNGQTQELSRSWNRLYSKFTFAKNNYVISFTPWWRIPEGDQVTTKTESGDDNPDITDYLGHFELEYAYKWYELEVSLKGRRNFSEDNGSFELEMTYPISERLNAYLQYTNGYGESLIDYDHSQQTIGIGFALNPIF